MCLLAPYILLYLEYELTLLIMITAGRDPVELKEMGGWKIVYETGQLIWIIFGLGYIFMIITAIGDSLKKPVKKWNKKIEKRLREEIMEIRAKKVIFYHLSVMTKVYLVINTCNI